MYTEVCLSQRMFVKELKICKNELEKCLKTPKGYEQNCFNGRWAFLECHTLASPFYNHCVSRAILGLQIVKGGGESYFYSICLSLQC